MLTAKLKTGELISLGIDYKKEVLMQLRQKEDFFCPICGEIVLLKLGDHRIFHFSHKPGGVCQDFHESETVEHLEGKRQLYQWLLKQKIPCILEFYDKEIKQRPDIMFHYNGKKFALEFQCSTLSEHDFIKRTATYLKSGYIPLWIPSNRHIHFKSRTIVTISNFTYLFLRAPANHSFYIPSYCTENKLFHFTGSIFPYSIKNAFAQHSVFSLDNISLDFLLEPRIKLSPIIHFNWNRELEKFTMNWTMHAGKCKDRFLNELYSRNLNLFLLPPEVGLPVPHALFIQTSPLIWQSYLFLDVIAEKQPGDIITVKEIMNQVNRRIDRKEIVLRHLPQLDQVNPFKPVREYFQVLMEQGILLRINSEVLQVEKKIQVPRTNREKEEAKQQFLKNYHHDLKYDK